jgi:hypothetical protein
MWLRCPDNQCRGDSLRLTDRAAEACRFGRAFTLIPTLMQKRFAVIPANTGIQRFGFRSVQKSRIPALAGMTRLVREARAQSAS